MIGAVYLYAKLCGELLCKPLKIVFDKCFPIGTYPAVWKKANVIPTHKKASKNEMKNHLPTFLLPILNKIFEL